MAHLWTREAGGWAAQKLAGTEIDLGALAAWQAPKAHQATSARMIARLVRTDLGGSSLWAIITSGVGDVRVNGRSVPAGLCALTDRDEIRMGAGVQYFSTEALAAAVEFPVSDQAVFCGRCRQKIETGSLAVCCPGCGIWYNQSADLPCWIYSSKCAFCGQRTALDSGFAWAPEED